MNEIEKVIEVHQKLLNQSEAPIAIMAEILWIFIGLLLIIHIIKDIKIFSLKKLIYMVFFLVIIFFTVGSLFTSIKKYDFSMNEKQWKEKYLEPYIVSLPTNKLEVEDFLLVLKRPNKGVKSVYINNKEKPIWCKISMVNKKGHETKINVQTKIQKENIKHAYLTYKVISKNISNDYKSDAFYETILHIPKDYRVLVPVK
ncbi:MULTISPECIES: hypothetical protein [Heyndrickxia]|uniref:Uncharacterized protein n=1 Tax=Heyndrickxia sporothermodurans TaxID=46224 RepID=A0A150LDV5_9BACI|nr:hypothetical protein [Heyndrickxia sporothermodurans]KYD09942.1 hypothetical protein B4102_2448 [Heyndrickxia sporothermodurans]MED3650467.1 hypothetical protein [Heyndrickxia sporothermodurans]MED3699256.1 hypothetical protein [Heyndrickxia sporothermodurans]